MKKVNSRIVRVGLLIAGLLAIGINLWMVWAGKTHTIQRASNFSTKQPPIPPEGRAEIDTHGEVPGHPELTVRDMKRLYKEITLYQKRHGGEYPSIEKGKNLHEDRIQNYREYGYASFLDAAKAFRNADMKYSDKAHGSAQPEDYYPYIENNKRPDGTLIGSSKSDGTRDVLAYTDIYYHQNIRVFKGDVTTTKPVGFYLVLWDDGEVQKVPYQDVRFAAPQPTGSGGLTQKIYFAGQAGAPPQGTLSRAEYDKWVHDHI